MSVGDDWTRARGRWRLAGLLDASQGAGGRPDTLAGGQVEPTEREFASALHRETAPGRRRRLDAIGTRPPNGR